jgi:hypothetical protein
VAGGSAFVKLGDRRSPQVFSEDDPISLQEACANGTFFKVKVRRS